MLRRFSTKFGKSKKDEVNGVGGSNGVTSTNGTEANGSYSNGSYTNATDTKGSYTNGTDTNGTSSDKPNIAKRGSSFGFPPKKPKSQAAAQMIDHTASRADVENAFTEYAQVIHASRRPLPSQGGDVAKLDHQQHSGLLSDIKAMGFKDVRTLIDVMKNKATGELQDDKTYLMEKTIQVSCAQQPVFVPCSYNQSS